MTHHTQDADLLAAFRDHHLHRQAGPPGLDMALGWWNRGWVVPIGFEPPTWVLTSLGLRHLDADSAGPGPAGRRQRPGPTQALRPPAPAAHASAMQMPEPARWPAPPAA